MISFDRFLLESKKSTRKVSGEDLDKDFLHYSAFDWDDNILCMPTKIKLIKDGKEAMVSTEQFAHLRSKPDFKEIYQVPQDAFQEFRDNGPRGKDAFLEDVKKAKRGPSWSEFVKTLTNAHFFAIITARGHNPETLRRGVEYLIDEVITEGQKTKLYKSCLKHKSFFHKLAKERGEEVQNEKEYSATPSNKTLSQDPLVKEYLDGCHFYGVSSPAFAQQFGASTAANPEEAKKKALKRFLDKCHENVKRLTKQGGFSIGFSDDDLKNVEVMDEFFKEESSLSYKYQVKYTIIDTSKKKAKEIKRTKYISDEKKNEANHQAWGTEGNVVPFSKWTSQSQWLHPSSPDAPTDDAHNAFKNRVGLLTDLGRGDRKNRRKKLKTKNETSKNLRKL